jgi:hypothetical protein
MISRITRVTALCFIFLTTSSGLAEDDAGLRSQLIGTWRESRYFGDEAHNQIMLLNGDGSFEVKGTKRLSETATQFLWRGKWGVREGKFWYVTTFSEPIDEFPIGESSEDEIVSVSKFEWVMIEKSTGNKSRAYRIK